MTQPLRPLALLLLLLAAGPAAAAQFIVDAPQDTVDANPGDGLCADAEGACTLRAAIMEANRTEFADVVSLPTGVYLLTRPSVGSVFDEANGSLVVNEPLVLQGGEKSSTVIDASAAGDRALHIFASAKVQDLTIEGGATTADGGGARVAIGAGRVELRRAIVEENAANNGGGVALAGAGGEALISDCVIRSNTATLNGGGLVNGSSAALAIEATAFLDNAAGRSGGALVAGSARIVNATIAGNSATESFGGGVFGNAGTLIEHSTIADNSGQPDLESSAASPMRLRASILRGSCRDAGDVDSLGGNVASDASCGLDGPDDVENADAMLAPLAEVLGPRYIFALQAGTPAEDRAGSEACPFSDAIGGLRDLPCDSGAFELGAGCFDDDLDAYFGFEVPVDPGACDGAPGPMDCRDDFFCWNDGGLDLPANLEDEDCDAVADSPTPEELLRRVVAAEDQGHDAGSVVLLLRIIAGQELPCGGLRLIAT